MTNKDIEKIEKMFEDCDGLDMSHVKKDDILAKAKQEMYFATKSEETKEKSAFPLFFTKKRFVPIMAGVALAFMICIGSIGVYAENYQTIYIDINPSVALKLNRFERVIGVEYLNEDAAALLADTKLVGCDATKALETVITACNSAGYVKDDSEIYISASAKEEKNSEKLLQKLKGHAETMREEKDETYAVSTYNAKKDEKKEIEKSSLSPAKYKVIKDIIDEDESFDMEELKGKSMEELRKIKHRYDDDDREDERDEHDDDDDREDEWEDHDERPENGKPENGKPENGKPENGKPENGKSEDGKPVNGKPQGGKPEDDAYDGQKPDDDDDDDDDEDDDDNKKR